MKKKIIAIGAIAITSISLTACTDYSADSTTSDSTSEPAVATDPVTDALDANYANSAKMCAYIASLVNQGWTNDEIYGQLEDGGAFDGYYGQGEEVWHKLTRWCAANPQ